MIEYLLLFKSLHIVGAVAWFGGLFYLVRIFVYHIEAFDKSAEEQGVLLPHFNIMEDRAYRIICIPAMLITWIFGCLIIAAYIEAQGWAWLRENSWLHTKLLAVVLLTGYQHMCKSIIKKLSAGKIPFSSFKMRLANEIPTIFLVIIVLLAVYRNTLNALYGIVGILIFGILLFVAAKKYKAKRESSR